MQLPIKLEHHNNIEKWIFSNILNSKFRSVFLLILLKTSDFSVFTLLL